MLVVSTVSRNLLIYIFLVSESIPVSITGCLKRVLGLQHISAHTVIRQDGGMGRSDPNRSASLFLSYNNYNNMYLKIVFQLQINNILAYYERFLVRFNTPSSINYLFHIKFNISIYWIQE